MSILEQNLITKLLRKKRSKKKEKKEPTRSQHYEKALVG